MDDIKELKVYFTDGTEDDTFSLLNGHPFHEDFEIINTEPYWYNAIVKYCEEYLDKEVAEIEEL